MNEAVTETMDNYYMAEIMWESYYALGNTPSQAMEALWSEYPLLVKWAEREYGVSETDLLQVISRMTMTLAGMDTSKTAIEAQKVVTQ
jgi:hypothetical protein